MLEKESPWRPFFLVCLNMRVKPLYIKKFSFVTVAAWLWKFLQNILFSIWAIYWDAPCCCKIAHLFCANRVFTVGFQVTKASFILLFTSCSNILELPQPPEWQHAKKGCNLSKRLHHSNLRQPAMMTFKYLKKVHLRLLWATLLVADTKPHEF